MDESLAGGAESSIIICLEINAFGDPNEAYPDPRLGQPSIFYATDRIDLDGEDSYFLMHRVAHGGNAVESGDRFYNFDEITTGGDLIEKVLVRVVRPSRGAASVNDQEGEGSDSGTDEEA